MNPLIASVVFIINIVVFFQDIISIIHRNSHLAKTPCLISYGHIVYVIKDLIINNMNNRIM